ncbi:MAG: UvrD-helicase domain-containing protein [Candidatus Liptonbacteria bacterium]|nr:UvrD-helicase domain-containing protein [Candidatus Liptonbacteria bacterium]
MSPHNRRKSTRSFPALNGAQLRAVDAPLTPLLIVAGAGTGKTLTLTSRIRRLIRDGIHPARICAITFTNKAAREMSERLVELTGPEHDTTRAASAAPNVPNGQPFIGTFHSLGARILRRECRAFGRTPTFTIFDDDDTLALIRRILRRRGIRREDAAPALLARAISAKKSGAGDTAASDAPLRKEEKLAAEIFEEYERELARHNAFDFDDLIEKVVRLLAAHPRIRARYGARYPHILIDEYQDVNAMQYRFVRLLGGFSSGRGGSISVVGDDQQMIYSWRGSDIDIFLNFETDWAAAHTVLLEENYRSSAAILAAASAVITHNRYQKPKTLWTKNPPGDRICIVETAGEQEEAEWIAAEVRATRSGANPQRRESIAVVYRTNAQSRPIEEAFLLAEIPHRVFGGVGFYERREIKDALALLRYTWNPQDEISRDRLKKTFSQAKFAALREAMRENKNPAELIEAFVRATDYFAYLERNFTNAAERRENVLGLIRHARRTEDLGLFLEHVALLEAHDVPGASADEEAPVSLMTIHLAKGLEFDRVYLAGASEGLLPHLRSMENERELEEERRLMYVAMTRARSALGISFYDIPSRFISEIPRPLYAFRNIVTGETTFSDNEERYISLD